MHFKVYRKVGEKLKKESAQVSCRGQFMRATEKRETRIVIMNSQTVVFDAQIACAASA